MKHTMVQPEFLAHWPPSVEEEQEYYEARSAKRYPSPLTAVDKWFWVAIKRMLGNKRHPSKLALHAALAKLP